MGEWDVEEWPADAWNTSRPQRKWDGWVVLWENVSEHRDMVYQPPRRSGVIVFGAVLSAWTLVCVALLAVTLCRRSPQIRRRPLTTLLLNFVLAHLLTAVIVVPLHVHTESVGSWVLGSKMCRAWLLLQVFLAALTMWSALAVTVDRLIYVRGPHLYQQRMTPCRTGSLLIFAWLASAATSLPAGVQMIRDPEFVLDEVCALAMSEPYALGVGVAAFFAPAVFVLLLTMAILGVTLRTRYRHPRDKLYAQPVNDLDPTTTEACCPHEEEDVRVIKVGEPQSIGNAAMTSVALNVTLVLLWAPFYILSMTIPFCEGMCVDPSVWSLCVWLGYASAGACPALCFLDSHVRAQIKDMMTCQKGAADICCQDKCGGSGATKWRFDDGLNVFKPYLHLKE